MLLADIHALPSLHPSLFGEMQKEFLTSRVEFLACHHSLCSLSGGGFDGFSASVVMTTTDFLSAESHCQANQDS